MHDSKNVQRTTIFVNKNKKTDFDDLIKGVKDSGIKNMSFSKMCILGSELITEIYNNLSEEELESVHDIYDLREIMFKKIIRKTD
ncbi:MAG: hypothetical protein ACSHWU_07665 [Marinicella sp.]